MSKTTKILIVIFLGPFEFTNLLIKNMALEYYIYLQQDYLE